MKAQRINQKKEIELQGETVIIKVSNVTRLANHNGYRFTSAVKMGKKELPLVKGFVGTIYIKEAWEKAIKKSDEELKAINEKYES